MEGGLHVVGMASFSTAVNVALNKHSNSNLIFK